MQIYSNYDLNAFYSQVSGGPGKSFFFTFYVLIIQGLLLDRYIIFREHNQNT